jgi:hypothetical protein
MNDTVVQVECLGGEEGEDEEEKEGEHGDAGLDDGRSRPGLARELVWPGSDWLTGQCRDSDPLDHYTL